MIFRQLYDAESSTYTYLLADAESREALLIDPVYEQVTRDLALISELGLWLKLTLDTHCHADHVTGAWLLQQKTGSLIAISKQAGVQNSDIQLRDGDVVGVEGLRLDVISTPGHTDGCITLVTNDRGMAFTGDCLLIRGCGRADFQQGDAATLFRSITEKLFSLPDSCIVYPAHDYAGRTSSTIGEERTHNPRAGGGASERDFVGYMDAMQLPHPKHLDIALPANLRSGMPEDRKMPLASDWAPIRVNFAGVAEIDPIWVSQHRDDVNILDVRQPEEVMDSADRLSGAQVIPLDELRDRVAEVPRNKPVVTFCRSGRRSAMAVSILQKDGVAKVANIAGGILRWRDEGCPL